MVSKLQMSAPEVVSGRRLMPEHSRKLARLQGMFFCHEISSDKAFLLRFLRAKNLDVDKAAKMLLAHINWRKKTFPLDVVSFQPELLLGFCYLCANDRNGRPNVVFDMSKLPRKIDTKKLLNIMIHVMEQAVSCAPETRESGGCINIIIIAWKLATTLKRVSFLKQVREICKIFQANYPCRLSRGFVFAPGMSGIVKKCWNIVKFFVDQETRRAIILCDGKPKGNDRAKDTISYFNRSCKEIEEHIDLRELKNAGFSGFDVFHKNIKSFACESLIDDADEIENIEISENCSQNIN